MFRHTRGRNAQRGLGVPLPRAVRCKLACSSALAFESTENYLGQFLPCDLSMRTWEGSVHSTRTLTFRQICQPVRSIPQPLLLVLIVAFGAYCLSLTARGSGTPSSQRFLRGLQQRLFLMDPIAHHQQL
jgi:hypothetical protein